MENKRLKILVIEDNPTDFFLLKEFIQLLSLPLNTIDNSPTVANALELLNGNNYDLIFLDLTLPDSEGFNTFTAINRICSHIPIIILSSVTNNDLALKIMKQGAQDYLVKGNFDSPLLEKVIKYSIERKKNLDAIRQSENRYKYLFENNPIPMWAFDIETKAFLIVNRAATAHYGYSEQEFLSMTIFDIRPEAHRKDLENVFNVHHEGIANKREWVHQKKNGEVIMVDIIAHNVVVSNRKARLILSYDVTERTQAQEEVAFQANILQNIRDIVVVTDLKGNITYWNSGATKILGYSPEEAIGMHISFLKYRKDELTLEEIFNHIEQEKTYVAQMQTLIKSKKSIWLNLKISYMLNMAQEKQSLLWIANDITEELRTKEKLLIQKSAIEAVGVGIMITDPLKKGNPIVVVNPKFESLTGYNAQEVIGKNCDFLFGEETDKATINEISNCIANQKSFDGEILNYRKDGESFWNKLLINPIFDDNGKLINYVVFQQDVTEAKKAKEDLLYKNRELNTFIYKSSHDLRSPLASLIGLIKFAQNETEDERIITYLKMMEESSEKLDNILKTLINMISFKQAELESECINFDGLVKEVLDTVKRKKAFANIDLLLHFDKRDQIKTDKKILYHILFQLLENAIKFRDIHKDKLKLEISLLKRPNKYCITIKDNGTGIHKKYTEKIFDMFFKANETYSGSGLGLYIVKNFVEKLQGRIYMQTEYGSGTSVIIELPVYVQYIEQSII